MKNLGKGLSLSLAAAMLVGLTACSTSDSGKDLPKVGIIQFAEFDALTQAQKGFVDGLADAGYVDGETVDLNIKSASADTNNCPTIADSLINDGSDLILAIATPSALAVKQKTTDIPVLITAVTDPAYSKLVADNQAPGGNITGTSDLNPIDKQMDQLLQVLPNAKNVAVLYCSSESNSKLQFDLAKAALEAKNITCTEKTIASIDEIKAVVSSLAGKVDAIYIPTDNTLADGMSAVSAAANEAKLPVFCGEGGMVKNGGLISYGINYYELGKQTAAMAVKILKGEAQPATMPIEYQTSDDALTTTVNTDTAAALGITIPEAILSGATVYPE